VVLVVILAALLTRRRHPGGADYPVPGERIPYEIEVLNGTAVDGLARTVTLRLRRAGFDVVSYGTSEQSVDSTLILVRGTDPDAGGAVREALGVGRVVAEPDAHLLLDVTVLLGRDSAGAVERGP
jgi:LytR cell envelope-related transcriptional attenuator